MNTFWLKIAALAFVVVGLIVLINVFSSSEPEPKPETQSGPKTLREQVDKDKSEFLTKPGAANAAEESRQTVKQQAPEGTKADEQAETTKQKPRQTEPIKLYFAVLPEMEKR